MSDLPGKDDRVGWWHLLRDTYEQNRKPHWREGLPSKTHEASQRRLWALYFASTYSKEHRGSTADGMESFITAYGRWIRTVEGDARTTVWGLLTRFAEGDGSLASATPEATVRAALKSVPADRALALLLRLACELVEARPRK